MIHKTTRSILSVLLAALLLVTSIPLTPAFAGVGGTVSLQSESGESEGLKPAADGTYLIYTAENLKEFAAIVNGTAEGIGQNTSANAKLMNNIVLNEKIEVDDNGAVTNQEELSEWTPIGTSSINSYKGTFDGNNYTISGLYIKSTAANNQGLFGYVGTGGTVKDLTVSGSVSGGEYVGGIVGYNSSGIVTNCAFSGSVSGNSYVGGVVGDNNDGTVENCYNTGEVSGNRDVGGVVGQSFGGSVTNCYNTGTVSGSYVGGVVGYNISSVTNCYNTGKVSGNSSVGGVVGHTDGGRVENCYNIGEVSGSPVGGVVGDNYAPVTNCYFLQQNGVPAQGIGSGYIERQTAEPVDNLTDQDQFEGWDFTDIWRISQSLGFPVLQDNAQDGLPPGLGTKASPYEISTADELETFRDLVNGEDGQTADTDAHARLMNDIDLNPGITFNANGTYSSPAGVAPQEWTPIGNSIGNSYEGTFNGDGHTISGLYINDRTADYQGLFGYVGTGGTVKDLTVSGDINGYKYVGGIVGYNDEGRVENCYNTGEVSGADDYVGGVVGDNGGTVINCYNTGEVSGPNSVISNVGGVVGDNGGTVINCYNTGNVSVKSSDISNVGGVVGYNDSSSTVTNCYNTGNVSVTSSDISSVSGDWYVGGVVGYNDSSSTVTNCYNTGNVSVTSSDISSVSGDWYVGGVVGYNNGGSVTGCYFLQQNGVPEQGFGEGSGDATAKDDTAFHSGEVAYLLQSKQADGSGQVWGQTLGGEEDSLPTLVALNPGAAKKVYQLTFDWRYEGALEGTTTTTNVYTNGSVTIPEINHDRTGYSISGWKDKNEKPVTAETTVEEDAVFTAEWTANTYTITVTAGSGGAVSGGGTFTENSKVTVTATPATGYHFVNWTENGTEVSTEATFTFNATVDRNLIAIFAKNEDPTPTPTPTPDPEPSGPSTGDSTGWDDILDELENTANGDEITIDMGDETKVPAEIFESLAGKDVDVIFDLGDIQWSVNGADIPTDTDFTDLDLGASLGTSGIPVNVINTITGEVGTVQITLAHDGEFGFTMTLTAPLGKENAGYWANLYHYDEDAEALNFEAAAKIDEDGSVTIPFSHASQYAIVIDTHSHATVDVSDLFSDIAPDAWYKDAVQYAYDNGLMTGVSDTEFAPEATTTRAMIVSILARLEGVTTAEAAGFADVNDNDWYATAVNWAANVGVVNGYEDNTFRPNTAITREQLAAILMNYAAYKGEDVSNRADLTSYTDQPSTWAEEAISWSVAEGLLTGVTADTLQPQGAATRAQVAAILQRFLSE